ncbi:GumC family protein [Myxococcota bacterium]
MSLPTLPATSPEPTTEQQGSSLPELWRITRKNRWLILTVAAAVLGAAVFFTLGQTKIYRATASLQIDPSPPQPLGSDVQAVVAMGADSYRSEKEYFDTQVKMLRGRRVAAEVVRTLRLNQDGAFLANLPPGQTAASSGVPIDTAVDRLLARIQVEPVRGTRLANVTLTDADPERARKLLSGLLDAFLQRNVDDVVSSANSAADWLRGQLVNLKADLENSERALHDYKTEKRILSVSVDDQSNMLRDEMQRLNQTLTEVRALRERLLSRNQELAKVNPAEPDAVPATELLKSELLGELRADYVRARAELAALLRSGRGANHPEAQSAQARVSGTRDALMHEINNIRGAVEGDLSAATREAAGLSSLMEAAKQRALDLNLLEIEYGRLERTKTHNEKLYALVLERSKESDLTSMLRFNNIRVAEDPRAGASPVKPRVSVNIGLGLFAGLLLGFTAAFVREQSDRTIKLPDDVEPVMGIPLLGVIPQVASAGSSRGRSRPGQRGQSSAIELLAHEQPHSNMAEACRSIRTNLMFMSPDAPLKCLLVTSSNPTEGKTTVASTIAVAMAQTGQRVLLLDCDLRRPRIHRIFQRTNDFGVTEATVDLARLNVADLVTSVPNLSVLPAGPRVPNPAELLQSASFEAVMRRLREEFDRIVIDSPPISVVSDAAILSRQADGVVFVARAAKTHRESARRSVRGLQSVGARVVGTVLNGLDLKRQGYSDYYYYYYHRHYHYDEPQVESRA